MDGLGDTTCRKQIGYKILYESRDRIGVYTCCIYCPRKIIVEGLNLKNPRVKRKNKSKNTDSRYRFGFARAVIVIVHLYRPCSQRG